MSDNLGVNGEESTPIFDPKLEPKLEPIRLIQSGIPFGSTVIFSLDPRVDLIILPNPESNPESNSESISNSNSLILAARTGQYSILRSLLEQGVSICFEYGFSLFHIAAKRGWYKTMKILIELRDGLKNEPDIDGITPLEHAIINKYWKISNILLQTGVVPDYKLIYEYYTPLHAAAFYGSIDLVEHLIKNFTFNLNNGDIYGNTPLHYAAQNGHLSLYHLLKKKGAIPDIRNGEGLTPTQYLQL